jgi:hypothetical protein
MFDVFVSDDFSYKAEVDEHGQLLLHMEIVNWSHTILRRMQIVARDGMEEFKNQGFTLAYCVTDDPELVQLVCPGELRSVTALDDVEYEVIVWDFH